MFDIYPTDPCERIPSPIRDPTSATYKLLPYYFRSHLLDYVGQGIASWCHLMRQGAYGRWTVYVAFRAPIWDKNLMNPDRLCPFWHDRPIIIATFRIVVIDIGDNSGKHSGYCVRWSAIVDGEELLVKYWPRHPEEHTTFFSCRNLYKFGSWH